MGPLLKVIGSHSFLKSAPLVQKMKLKCNEEIKHFLLPSEKDCINFIAHLLQYAPQTKKKYF